MKNLKGGVHIHSTYSYDGRIPLENLVEKFKEFGFDFIIITEHNDGLTPDILQGIERKCQDLSTGNFTVIPGIEIRCEGDIHLMGIGGNVLRFFDEGISLIAAIERVKGLGGLAILAHPPDNLDITLPDSITLLDGLEIWNNRRDTLWSPRLRSTYLLERIRKNNPNVLAFAGLDLHDYQQFPTPYIWVSGVENNTASILKAIKEGHFNMIGSLIKIPGLMPISRMMLVKIKMIVMFKFFIPVINRCVSVHGRRYLKKLLNYK